jgi:hypothetical protein
MLSSLLVTLALGIPSDDGIINTLDGSSGSGSAACSFAPTTEERVMDWANFFSSQFHLDYLRFD